MKLLSLYIKGFGKFQDHQIKFQDGLNVICEPNGFGKTTISAFIKAMFYGLENVKRNSYTDRERYLPQTVYGGSLLFEYLGDEYRIERTFEPKTAANDSLIVYRNGTLIDVKDAGFYFFGVDRSSFERTLYVTADDEITGTDGIKAKIGNYSDGAKEKLDFGDISSKIENEISVLKRRNHFKTGLIDVKTCELQEIKEEIANIERSVATLPKYVLQKEETKRELSAIDKELQEARILDVLAEKQNVLKGYQAEMSELESECTTLSEYFQNGVPTQDEITFVESKLSDFEKFSSLSLGYKNKNGAELKKYQDYFQNGIPTEDDFNNTEKALLEYSDVINKLNGLDTSFSVDETVKTVDKNDLDVLSEKIAKSEVYSKERKERKALPKSFFVALALSVLSLAAGGGIFYFQNIIGIVLLSVGGAGLLCSLIISLVYKTKGKGLDKDISALNDDIKTLLTKYGYSGEDPTSQYHDLLTKRNDYLNALEKCETNKKRFEELSQRAEELNPQISEFFEPFGVSVYSLSKLYEIKALATGALSLIERANRDNEKFEEYAKVANEAFAAAKSVLDKYGFSASTSISEIKIKVYDLNNKRQELSRAKDRISAYISQNDLKDLTLVQKTDTAYLDERRTELLGVLSEAERNLAEKEVMIPRLEDLKNKFIQVKEELDEYKEKYRLLCECKRLLNQAESNLKEKYVAPVKDRFLHYAKQIGFEKAFNTYLNEDFELSYEDKGQLKNVKIMSKGELTLCSLCYRMALIDNVYKQEPPFIILDDPFIYLDEQNFISVQTALKELSLTRQIIYVTCHNSRNIK